jgi:protein-disulfide isomerase
LRAFPRPTVFKPLKADYIDTGKVHFTLREVYFDRYGLWAAMIARCGGDLKYFGIHRHAVRHPVRMGGDRRSDGRRWRT